VVRKWVFRQGRHITPINVIFGRPASSVPTLHVYRCGNVGVQPQTVKIWNFALPTYFPVRGDSFSQFLTKFSAFVRSDVFRILERGQSLPSPAPPFPSRLSLSFPSLPSLLSFPFPSPPFPSLPFPLFLKVSPSNSARGYGGAL